MAAYITVQQGAPGTRTWTVPDGVTQLYYVLVGGGGGGNVANSATSTSGGGGQAVAGVVAVTPGQVLTVTVGNGGAPGNNGGNSSVTGTGVSITALAGLANGQSRAYNNAGVLNTPAARPAGAPYYGGTNGAGTGGSATSTTVGPAQTITSVDLSTYAMGRGGAATPSSAPAGVAANGTNYVGNGGDSGQITNKYDTYGAYIGPNVDTYGNPVSFQSGGSGGWGAVYFAYSVDYTTRILRMSEIQANFPQGVNPINLSEYYAGGLYVPSGTIGYPGNNPFPIPTSGVISISNFEGAYPGWIFNYTLASGQSATNLNVLEMALAAGFPNGQGATALPLRAYINIAGVAGASITANYGLTVGSGYNRTPLIVINVSAGGFITGAGGGGSVSTAVGGTALRLTQPTLLVNNGIIQAGGGASIGGAGGAGYVPGAGLSGSTSGSLQSGGKGFPSSSAKKSYTPGGGYGGGWVANSESPSTDGWGAGRDDAFHGGYQPGTCIAGVGQLQPGSVVGTLRGTSTI